MPKPPRDTAQKWLAAGALIAVAVGVSFASNALKNHLAGTLPQPEPTSYTPLISSPPPVATSPKTPEEEDDDAPPANDPRTLPSGTPKSSAAAMPQWARFDASPRLGDKVVMRYAPIHSRASLIFAGAPVPAEDVSHAFVVCRGSANDDKADLVLRVTFGTTPELASDARRQLGQTLVSAPLAEAKKGQSVNATLFARKLGGLTPLVEMRAKLGDDDLRRDDEAGSIECAVLAGDALLDRIAADAGRADATIARVAALRVDTTKDFDIDPKGEEANARRRISDLAALTGWADPRVKARLAALDAALAKNDVEERRAFEELHRDATKEAVVGDVTLELDRVACSADKCELAVFVRNGGTQSLGWQRDTLDINYLVLEKDHVDQESEDEHLEAMVLAPGEQRKTILTAPPEMTRAKSLTQICFRGGVTARCGVIRVH